MNTLNSMKNSPAVEEMLSMLYEYEFCLVLSAVFIDDYFMTEFKSYDIAEKKSKAVYEFQFISLKCMPLIIGSPQAFIKFECWSNYFCFVMCTYLSKPANHSLTIELTLDTHLVPGFMSSLYQFRVWRIVRMYRLYAVLGVEDLLVKISTSKMDGIDRTAIKPHSAAVTIPARLDKANCWPLQHRQNCQKLSNHARGKYMETTHQLYNPSKEASQSRFVPFKFDCVIPRWLFNFIVINVFVNRDHSRVVQ